MECSYCGKNFEEGASIYCKGKAAAAFCSSTCMQKAFKKMIRLLGKMSPEQTENFLNKYNKKKGAASITD